MVAILALVLILLALLVKSHQKATGQAYRTIYERRDPEVVNAVIRAANQAGVDDRLAVAICLVESHAQANVAVSPKGAVGIMQCTAIAQEEVGFFITPVSSLDDQAYCGALYLRYLFANYGDKGQDWIVRAYNAGAGGANAGLAQSYLADVKAFLTLIP